MTKKPFWETILVQMHETLKHRGPDQAMIDLQPHVGLSHARLSIRDLKSGIQPMTRTFHGKTCSIVYNGEIYNHRELLPELQAAGYRFTTNVRHGNHSVRLYAFRKRLCRKVKWDFRICDLGRYHQRTASLP